jgi:hypothetical protein
MGWLNHASLHPVGHPWVVARLVTYPENAERVKRIKETFGSVGIKPTIKVTAFNLNVQESH